MDRQWTGGQLHQFLCAMQWFRSSIPQFETLVYPLHTFLEAVYTHVGKRTKRAVTRVSLDALGWDSSLTQAFEKYKNSVAKRVTLAHRDDSKRLCIYTDASDTHWSGIVTQVLISDLFLPHSNRPHEPFAFHSDRFSPTHIGWPTAEKGACAVLASVGRSHWLAVYPSGFELYADHNNLVFIFDPAPIMPHIGQATIRKFLR